MASGILESYESVAVSTRMRLARNFADYPFPRRLLRDPHAKEQAQEIVQLVSAELNAVESFLFYQMDSISEETAAYLTECNLISRELIRNDKISAALISEDKTISVMLNEEDHLREQYFAGGYNLQKAYERIYAIDEIISRSIPFAYDETLGYLTACPTNLGTGLRASVMLFLPALSRRGLMWRLPSVLTQGGLTVRGSSGEGSGSEGDTYQVSNEMTLGLSEAEILELVKQAVDTLVEMEINERKRMRAEEGIVLRDNLLRSFGILSSCARMDLKELVSRTADAKLAVALGFLQGDKKGEELMRDLDDLVVALRPANIGRENGAPLSEEEQDEFRAVRAGEFLHGLNIRSTPHRA